MTGQEWFQWAMDAAMDQDNKEALAALRLFHGFDTVPPLGKEILKSAAAYLAGLYDLGSVGGLTTRLFDERKGLILSMWEDVWIEAEATIGEFLMQHRLEVVGKDKKASYILERAQRYLEGEALPFPGGSTRDFDGGH